VARRRAVTVALDGYGAEQGFEALAEGARLAAADAIGIRVFGPQRALGLDGVEGIEVVQTADHIGNDEEPVPAVRTKKEASVVRAARDVSEGNSAAMVSCGSTGATMAAATFGLRRLKGVKRPALAVQLPVPGKPVLFLDVGANVEVRAQHLVQFAFLGAAFSAAVLDVKDPSVGLLTVGEESGKGREEVVEAHSLLSEAPGINFAGNVEGRDLPAARTDVVVTDGFTGNVSLKLLEGTARTVAAAVGDAARSNPMAAAGGLLLKPALNSLRRELHPDTTGGAILLGLRAVAVVGHGSSGAEGIANAVRLAARCAEVDAVGRTAALINNAKQ
jgi:glycerol-3-phosphate acyltransferase PlsX